MGMRETNIGKGLEGNTNGRGMRWWVVQGVFSFIYNVMISTM
jgi:hypothetical protein